MKTRILSVVAIMVMTITTSFAQSEKKEQIKVAGNCGMCETRIETAAKSVDGVKSAEWNKETKMLELVYDSGKTDLDKIEKAIAKAGHDTKLYKAGSESYKNLPSCCKYVRMKENSNDKKN